LRSSSIGKCEIGLLEISIRRGLKTKILSFDGEVNYGQEVEAWLLRMRKYFQVHNYFDNIKDIMDLFNLNNRALIWGGGGISNRSIKSMRERLSRSTFSGSISLIFMS
jgi:hypothetical protein